MNIDLDNQLTGVVIGAAIDVHRQLGPQLEESVYEQALSWRLTNIGISNQTQVPLPLMYKGVYLDCGYRLDLLVENRLPIELKVVAALLGIHDAQLLTYQRIGRYKLGLLINFNVAVLKDGLRRKVETREWKPNINLPYSIDEMKAFDPVSAAVVLAAIEIHREIGPGLLASTYLTCLRHELSLRRIPFECKKQIEIMFEGKRLDACAEIPLVVAAEVPVFPISAEALTPMHTATALARLRQGGWKQGLILNFNLQTMSKGIKRVVI